MWRITPATFAFLATALSAQTGPGTTLRIRRVDAPTVVGNFLERRADSIVIAPAGRGRVAIPAAAVERIDRLTDHGNHALLGGVIGAAAGATAAIVFLDNFCGGDSVCDGDEQVRAALIFGLPPTAVGAIIGTLIKKERWERIDPARLTIAPGPMGRGIAVGVRLPLGR